MSKPINGIKQLCDHCETKQVKNLAGIEVTRYICDLQNNIESTYSKPCTMYDWNRCEKNEDK